MWSRLYPAVYRVAGVPETWRQALMAACLAWGDGAVVSHIAAAALWGLVGFEPGRVELSVPRMQRRARGHLEIGIVGMEIGAGIRQADRLAVLLHVGEDQDIRVLRMVEGKVRIYCPYLEVRVDE